MLVVIINTNMKLYLSSYRLGNKSQIFTDSFGENKKVAVIANSMDFLTDKEARKESAQREIDDLKRLGLDPEEVDLRDYFGKPEALAQKLKEYGGLWVRGGNVFILRRAFKESGMDEWLKTQKDNKELVYGGYSAGVCVLSPKLNGLELVDDPNNVPEGYNTDVEWVGVGIVNWAFAPHYMSQHPESEAVSSLVEYFKKEGIEFKALSDGEVIRE